MTTLYLITGFLGAGKTSFLTEFIKLFHDKKIQIIINEFGKAGVDGKLVADSLEISGGSIFCSCRSEQFEKYLNMTLEKSPDIIIVESSGLSDPSSIRKILAKYENINYGGCICIADAVNLEKIFATARVCKKQLSVSDAVLLNKTDIATQDQISKSIEIIKSHRPNADITETVYGRIPDNWLGSLHVTNDESAVNIHTADLNLHSMSVRISSNITLYELNKFIEMFIEDTYRVKGFIKTADNLYFVDCVGANVKITPYCESISTDNILTVLYGYGLKARKSVMKAVEWYPDKVMEVY